MRAAGDLEEVVGRVRVCEEDSGEGGEDGLRRFAGWKKSVRVLEDAIFHPLFSQTVAGGAREFLSGGKVSIKGLYCMQKI